MNTSSSTSNNNVMQTYKVVYSGNATNFNNFERIVNATSEREAVEDVYRTIMDHNYFPQDDGSILDCDGHTIADANDSAIEYDGGYFTAHHPIIKFMVVIGSNHNPRSKAFNVYEDEFESVPDVSNDDFHFENEKQATDKMTKIGVVDYHIEEVEVW